MRSLHRALAVVVTAAVVAGTSVAASAQGTLQDASRLYASAAYEDALAMLDRLPPDGLDVTTRVTIDHYRMLCLLALGRTDEAELAITRLLELHPAYTVRPDDASPRVVRVFLDVRRRVLPEVIRRRFETARTLQAAGDHAGAATAFGVIRTLLADGGDSASDAALAALIDLVARGENASRGALAAEERTATEAPAVVATPTEDITRTTAAPSPEPLASTPPEPRAAPPRPAIAAASAPVTATTSTTAAAPDAAPLRAPPDGIYTMIDRGVVPPVALRQDVRRWFGPMPPPMAGTPLGQVQFVVDETGAVTDLSVVASVSAFYDAVVIESVRNWRYQPATKDGRPVKFRRVVSILSR